MQFIPRSFLRGIFVVSFTSALSLEKHYHTRRINALPVSHPHYPSPRTTLASPRKRVRFCCSVKPSNYGGDCFPSAPSMRFSTLSLASHQPSRTRTIPRLAPHSWLPCQRELDCDKAISYYKLQHSAISSTLIFAQPYLSQD